MTKNSNQKILLDADIIIHFIKGEKILLLPKIFQQKKVILDIVCQELVKNPNMKVFYENLIRFGLIEEISFTNDFAVIKEYARLKMMFGNGESACMAYCKFHKDILASSNLSDIKKYCDNNNIQYLTTMDFLCEAFRKNKMSEAECDEFIYNVLSKGSILPCKTIKEFLSK